MTPSGSEQSFLVAAAGSIWMSPSSAVYDVV